MDKTTKTIRIKWVRSGIGFTHQQKTIVRSLGLNKLNHTVVRPDTPQIRGVVAAIPHMLKIVPEPSTPAWAGVPEYTVHAAVAAPETAVAEAAAPQAASDNVAPETTPATGGDEPAQAGKE